MNIKKFFLRKRKPLNSHFFFQQNSHEATLIGQFLTDSYNEEYTRKWLQNETSEGLATNMIVVLKRGNNMIFFNIYTEDIYDKDAFDESTLQHTFTISQDVFIKILDQWKQVQAQSKEFIIIEVTPHNDVIITTTDQLTEEDRLLCESLPKYYP